MISPELLRRYPFFGFLDDTQLKAMAMVGEEIEFEKGDVVLESGQKALGLYFMTEGSAELFYVVEDAYHPELNKELYVSDLNPGEVLGISALIEPYIYTGTIRAAGHCRVIRLDAVALRGMCELDAKLACGMMRKIARATMDRLENTRIQLAAARA
jgi:CRP/FNR family cyclic AMP-dependent transcriptional regulator